MNLAVPYTAVADQLPMIATGSPAPRRLVVADVGGTFARIAEVVIAPGRSPDVLAYRKYAGAEHADLAAILRRFIDEEATSPLEDAVVAIAGVLDGDTLVNANLPWPVSIARTREAASLSSLQLINDFEAVAFAIPHVAPEGLLSLTEEGAAHRFQWPALVIGPGTGLGAALRFEGGERPVLASEVGHAALAAGTELELQVLHRLLKRWSHVDNERVLSGNGLMNLYPALCEIRGATPHWQTPEQLIAAANAGDDAIAVETLEVFSGWLGSLIGDLVITFGARSVYLAGGISAHVETFLRGRTFRERYSDKGVLGHVVRHVPVWRVDHGQLGIVGAAAWFQQHAP